MSALVEEPVDVIAVGAGPANLSLAALAAGVPGLTVRVLEARPRVTWHEGLLPRAAKLQVSPLKDLVTQIDPTSRFSFLNFLVQRGRLSRALIAHRTSVSRREFAQYYAWAAGELPDVRLGCAVTRVEHDGAFFVVNAGGHLHRSRHLVLGIGQTPEVPAFAQPLLGEQVFHSSRYSEGARDWTGRRVLIVGGGQSSAEIFLDLLSGYPGRPRAVSWVSSRAGLRPLDDSPFSNELYNPRYTEFFARLDAPRRQQLLRADVLTSDGISEDLLAEIYSALYDNDYLDETPMEHAIMTSARATSLVRSGSGYQALITSELTGRVTELDCDTVVMATGYATRLAWVLDGLGYDHGATLQVNADYSLPLDGVKPGRVFVQNAGRESHGLADSNLAIMPWRSATILRTILEKERSSTVRDDVAGRYEATHLAREKEEFDAQGIH